MMTDKTKTATEPPLDCLIMPRELTTENGAKAMMIGEFS